MEKIREKCSKWIEKRNSASIGKWDWMLLGVMLAFMLVTMFYGDFAIIYRHSLTFLDSLFSLDMANFYANTLENTYYGFGAVYYWIVYAVFAVWNIPVWVLCQVFGIDTFSIKCLLWGRLEVVFFFVLTLWMLEKLLKDFGFEKEKCRFVQFMFASSLLVVLPVFAISQIDIVTLFFILLGIREYVKTDKISWKFLLIFSFAASLKIFALFLFIPLVLLREKRILYVLWDIVMGTVFILLCLIPYAGRADYVESTSILNDVMVERMFNVTIPAGNVEIPIFLTLFVGICIWCYVKRVNGKEAYFYDSLWIGLLVFADFFIFVFAHPYWIILIAPFLVILLLLNQKDMKVNMILTFFIEVTVSVFYCATFGVYCISSTFTDLILPKFGLVPNETGYLGFGDFVIQKGFEMYVPVLYGMFAICLIAFLILNYPWKNGRDVAWKEQIGKKLTFDYGMVFLRLISVFAFIVACIYFSYLN